MGNHPYREPAGRPTCPATREPLSPDDVVVAVMLFLLGALGLGIGVSCDRGLELSLGLILIALSAKVVHDARRAAGR